MARTGSARDHRLLFDGRTPLGSLSASKSELISCATPIFGRGRLGARPESRRRVPAAVDLKLPTHFERGDGNGHGLFA